MKTYLKTAFTKPKEIYIGRNMRNKHFFLIVLLMSLSMALLSIFQLIPALQTIEQDFTEIKDSIPDFELENNQLRSDQESFIYQTDSMIFYFDPSDKISTDTIDKNMENIQVPVSAGLLDDSLYINFLGQGYSIPYANIENLSTADLQTLIMSFGDISPQVMSLMIIPLFIFSLFLYLYQLLPIALFANVIALMNGVRLRLFQTIKITVLASMLPFLLIGALEAILFPIAYSFEIVMVISLFVFYLSITELKKRINEQK